MCWAVPFLYVALTIAEMIYLMIAVVTGNWGGALTSVLLFFGSLLLVNVLGNALSQAGVC